MGMFLLCWLFDPFWGGERPLGGEVVNTTPQMTCFRGAKVCTKWQQGKSDDRIIQLDNKLELGTSYKLKLGPR